MKKGWIIWIMIMCTRSAAWACEVCKKQQPEVLRGIAHGAGPQSDWDYVIIGITVLIVLASLFYTIKWIVRPGEKERSHIKYRILNTGQP